jgi:hypothetical protein
MRRITRRAGASSERRRSRPGCYSTQSCADRIGEPDKGGDNLSKCDGYRAGVPCWVAAVLPDPEKAVAFYTELFDWEARETMGLAHPKSTSSAPFVAATSPRSARSAAGRAVRARVAHQHPGGERRLYHRQGEKSGRSVVMKPSDLLDAAREAVVSDQVGQSSACGSKASTRVPGSLTSRVHGAAVFCTRELPVANYGKDLASSSRRTPLSVSITRNLSSPAFVVWQQYGK